jgi:hypothetical protein
MKNERYHRPKWKDGIHYEQKEEQKPLEVYGDPPPPPKKKRKVPRMRAQTLTITYN